jgi:predicted GIY-YIG superfamily endonuclease
MPTVYVLLCEQNRYYIGKTYRPLQLRVKEHFNGTGSEWTKRYKPIKIVEQIMNADEFDEDKYTKKYMKQYGIENVRGGSYTQVCLSEYSRLALERELCSASDLCFRCNRSSHFAKDCYAITKSDGSPIQGSECSDDEWQYCENEFESDKHEELDKKSIFNTFFRVADTVLKATDLLFTTNPQSEKLSKCYRCGRPGHVSARCYASTHCNGDLL